MQRDEAWFAARAGKLTGSRFADLMARTKSGPSATRENLIANLAFERILGTCLPTYQSAAMQRGIELEDEAIRAYEDREMVVVERVDYIEHPALPFVGCSPDGLVGSDGLVEVKCLSAGAKFAAALFDGAHAAEYRWQLQGQLWVSGRSWVDAVAYYHPDLPLAITRVERDESAIAELETACIAANDEIEQLVTKLRELKEAA